MTIREKEAKVIRWATGQIIEGRSLGAVAKDLNDQGLLRTSQRKGMDRAGRVPWAYSTLRDVLVLATPG